MTGITGFGRVRKSILAITSTILLTLFVLPTTDALGSSKGKVSKEVERRVGASAADDQVRVIIQTHGQPSSTHFNRLHKRGGSVKRTHSAIRGYAAAIPASQIQGFADDPEIERVSLDAPVQAHLDVAHQAIRADAALVSTGGLDGSGVGVAVIDTGVQGHVDLLRPKGAPQLIEVEIVGSEPGLADYYGHGTHVAGIIAGNGAESSDSYSFRTFRGIAPGVKLISLRALYPDGSGYSSDIIAAIDWAIAHKDDYNIRVINLSLGHPVFESYTTDPTCRAVRAATAAGIVVVASAGNDGGIGSGFGTITSPGNEPTAITVGAMDDDDTVTITDDVLAWYSSKGPTLVDFVVKPDLVAPGTWVVSTRAAGSYLDTEYHQLTLLKDDYKDEPGKAVKDGLYYSLSGTSMAAPMVSATAALMIQKEPDLTPGDVKARLMVSASRLDEYNVFEVGAGYLEVEAALQSQVRSESVPYVEAVLKPNGSVMVEDQGLIWTIRWTQGLIWTWNGGYNYFSVYDSSALENDQVTATGAIWDGGVSINPRGQSTVDILGGIWDGGASTRGRKK
jgi:serine protease AprX